MVKRKPSQTTCRLAFLFALLAGLIGGALPVMAQKHYKPETAAHFQNGLRLYRDNQLGQAQSEFEIVVKMEPDAPDAYNMLGLIYALKKDAAKAQQNYRKALDREPNYPPALSNLGLILYSQGKAEAALDYWQRCLDVSKSQDPNLYYYIANAQRDTGRKDEARKNYLASLDLKKDNAAAWSGLAALDQSEGRLDIALSEINRSIQIKPNSAFSYYHLGRIEEKLAHKDAALKAYQTSLKYENLEKYRGETNQRIARLNGPPAESAADDEIKGRALKALKSAQWADAARDLDGLTHGSAAEDPVVWNNLGLALAGESQDGKAAEAYRKAVALRRDGFPEAQFNLGMVLRHSGNNPAAEKAFKQAIEDSARQRKTNPYAQNMLGIIRRERGDFDGAERAFRLALAQAGDSLPVVHYNLAVLLERNERSRDAVSQYQTYLNLSPSGKNAQAARIRLKRLIGT